MGRQLSEVQLGYLELAVVLGAQVVDVALEGQRVHRDHHVEPVDVSQVRKLSLQTLLLRDVYNSSFFESVRLGRAGQVVYLVL